MTELLAALPEEIAAARDRLGDRVLQTPVTPARWLPGDVWLKCEHLQHTGSFKLRGALNRLLRLTAEERAAGVLAASTGNHGQGVALAAQLTGAQARVFVPESASPVKLEAMALLGAEIETVAGDGLAAELAARAEAEATGRVFISPYNDPDVVAGQGTVGLELAEQLPDLDTVFVAVGGGGLISGVAAALKARRPALKVVGCWPANAPALQVCLERGAIGPVPESPTLSDGTAGGVEAGAITFELARALVDEHVLVDEDQIRSALRELAVRERWMVEGSAAVALAGCLAGDPAGRGRAAVVLCGRNIDPDRFTAALAAAG